MKIDAITREKIVIAMDLYGWEQDGNGPTFVNVKCDGERKTFKNWNEVLDFVVMIAKS